MQLAKSNRLVARRAQALQQPLLLGVNGNQRPDCCPPQGLWARRVAGGGRRGFSRRPRSATRMSGR
jgi:hypothetical protein